MTESGRLDFYTLEGFIAYQQRLYPSSRGVFSDILRRIGVASKIISSKVRMAGLIDVLGKQGVQNVQGEEQMKLDLLANDTMKTSLKMLPSIAGLASEEDGEMTIVAQPDNFDGDHYIVFFDPIDGSSNIDVNVSVGTVFSVHRCPHHPDVIDESAFLKPGNAQVAAGYVVYGSSTMFVYTTGQGVHGFTLDPEIGEFVLSHENIKTPDRCKYFSANDSNYRRWTEPTRRFVDRIRGGSEPRYEKTSSRYTGSLVADVHRNILEGGVFMYPENQDTGKGKLRLLYECSPMAMIFEQAGGLATTGKERILDIQPTHLHQRVPFVAGNRHEVELYEKILSGAE